MPYGYIFRSAPGQNKRLLDPGPRLWQFSPPLGEDGEPAYPAVPDSASRGLKYRYPLTGHNLLR